MFPKMSKMRKFLHNSKEPYSKSRRLIQEPLESKYIDVLLEMQKIKNLIQRIRPSMNGYSRKDPFQILFDILNILHEHLSFYKFKDELKNLGRDAWEAFYQTNQIQTHCPLYDSMVSILSLDYHCLKCQHRQTLEHSINYLKLDLPKKRKKNKVIERQLTEKGYTSPRKRGRSLISMILPESEMPITIPELLIQFLRQQLYIEQQFDNSFRKYCSNCNDKEQPMKNIKNNFKKIADVLILQINRMPKYTDSVQQTYVQLNHHEMLNLSPFLETGKERCQSQKQRSNSINKAPATSRANSARKNPMQKENNEASSENSLIYKFQTAICYEKGLFPVYCKSRFNNQIYSLTNETVQMTKQKGNPYVICLQKICSAQAQKLYKDVIVQDVTLKKQMTQLSKQEAQKMTQFTVTLPDFYDIQLKHGIQLPMYQPLSCHHSKLKPYVQRKSFENRLVTKKFYEDLVSTYKGTKFENQICEICLQKTEELRLRKSREKDLIKLYDSSKIQAFCMVSNSWIRKWSNFLYANQSQSYSYFDKGYPIPPPIDNKVLLKDSKCRSNLIKNKDFKVVNIFVWKLLKQLYGGGPQIRYKWKRSELGALDQQKIKQIRTQVKQLKEIYVLSYQPFMSPQKTISLQKSSSYMESANQSELQEEEIDMQEIDLQEPE